MGEEDQRGERAGVTVPVSRKASKSVCGTCFAVSSSAGTCTLPCSCASGVPSGVPSGLPRGPSELHSTISNLTPSPLPANSTLSLPTPSLPPLQPAPPSANSIPPGADVTADVAGHAGADAAPDGRSALGSLLPLAGLGEPCGATGSGSSDLGVVPAAVGVPGAEGVPRAASRRSVGFDLDADCRMEEDEEGQGEGGAGGTDQRGPGLGDATGPGAGVGVAHMESAGIAYSDLRSVWLGSRMGSVASTHESIQRGPSRHGHSVSFHAPAGTSEAAPAPEGATNSSNATSNSTIPELRSAWLGCRMGSIAGSQRLVSFQEPNSTPDPTTHRTDIASFGTGAVAVAGGTPGEKGQAAPMGDLRSVWLGSRMGSIAGSPRLVTFQEPPPNSTVIRTANQTGTGAGSGVGGAPAAAQGAGASEGGGEGSEERSPMPDLRSVWLGSRQGSVVAPPGRAARSVCFQEPSVTAVTGAVTIETPSGDAVTMGPAAPVPDLRRVWLGSRQGTVAAPAGAEGGGEGDQEEGEERGAEGAVGASHGTEAVGHAGASVPSPLQDWRRLTKGKGVGSRSLGRTVNWATEVSPNLETGSHFQAYFDSLSESPRLSHSHPDAKTLQGSKTQGAGQVGQLAGQLAGQQAGQLGEPSFPWAGLAGEVGHEGLSRYAARDRHVSFQEEEYSDMKMGYSDMDEENEAHCEGPRAQGELKVRELRSMWLGSRQGSVAHGTDGGGGEDDAESELECELEVATGEEHSSIDNGNSSRNSTAGGYKGPLEGRFHGLVDDDSCTMEMECVEGSGVLQFADRKEQTTASPKFVGVFPDSRASSIGK